MSLIRHSKKDAMCHTLGAQWKQPHSGRIFTATAIGLASFPALLCFSNSAAVAQTSTPQGNNMLFVNPNVGNDTTGNGSERTPFKTITRALQVAQFNNTIVLAQGTYSTTSGETFPLMLKPGVSLQGDPYTRGRNIIIQGGGAFLSPTFARQDITILGASQARLSGVTITNPHPRGYGLWIESSSPIVISNTFTGNTHDGISMTGSSAPTIRSNYFYQNGANGITIYGMSQPEVQENVFEATGYGINVAQQAAPMLVHNRIIHNRSGIVSEANSHPVLRGNVIEGNTEDGVVAITASRPDLGTATEPGGNVFSQNGRYDINSRASNQTIPAFGDQLTSTQIVGSINLGVAQNPQTSGKPLSENIALLPSTNKGVGWLPTPRRPRQVAQGATSKDLPVLPSAPLVPQSAAKPLILYVPPPASLLTNTSSSLTPRRSVGKIAASNSSAAGSFPFFTPKQIAAPGTTAGNLPVLQPASAEVSPAKDKAPIVLNVPPPASTTELLPTSAPTSSSASDTEVRPTTIPLSSSVSSAQTPRPLATSTLLAPPPSQTLPVLNSAPIDESELLPVPNSKIPIGHTRKSPKRTTVQPSLRTATALSPMPSSTKSLSLLYRVVVEASRKSEQAKVHKLVPNAFRTSSHGRVVMQAGIFSDRVNAEQVIQLLTSNGLRATLERMN
ncbi:MAG: DUF1565 domain-containing protein [Chroococcidiopsidaceae cyanobacterium CP_BM_RX_35]|nr:DUF1565 domain-containing protein [Chroococcidiopsidaceae cyanobacterium CP_BM_RX_35]